MSTKSCIPTAFLPITVTMNAANEGASGKLDIDCVDFTVDEDSSIYL